MSTISINLRLRPIRFAFLIRPDDQKQTLNGYLDFFEPDFVVEAEKGIAGGLGFDPARILKFSDILVRDGDRDNEGFGLSAKDLYGDLYKKEFQFARRHKHNIIFVKPEDSLFSTFVGCIFGAFPTQRKLRYFEQNYKYVFEPQEIGLTDKSLSELYKTGYTSTLKIGQAVLDVNYNDHSDPALFVLNAHESRDLIDFWNLRIVRRNILAIPIQWIQELSPFCREFILQNHRPLPGNPHGVMIQPIVMFSRSISEKDSDETFKKYLRVDKND